MPKLPLAKAMKNTYTFTTNVPPLQPPLGVNKYPQMPVPLAVADELLEDKSLVRVVLTFSNGLQTHRALRKNKNGETFISIGKSTLKEAKIEWGCDIEVSLHIDASEFGFAMPEELAELLKQDPEGDAAFRKLKPGNQRSFLYYIGSAKTIDTRINRALQLVNNLKAGIISAGKPK